MQAIFELLLAIIGGFVVALAGLVSALLQLALFAVEFLFIAATQGLGQAREQANEARLRRSVRTDEQPGAPADQSAGNSSHPGSVWGAIGLMGVLIAVGIGLYVSRQIRAARIETAKTLVGQCADDVAETIALGQAPPARGELPVQDPWKKPLELFLDDLAVGTLVVVRSAGPDQRTGTIDDLVGIRMQQKPVKQLAVDAGNVVVDQVKEKALNLLKREPRKDQ
jgi:hypothetical protein